MIVAWLGPAIGASAYEVGADVRDAYVAQDPAAEPLLRAERGRALAGGPLRPCTRELERRGCHGRRGRRVLHVHRIAAFLLAPPRSPVREDGHSDLAWLKAPQGGRSRRGGYT